MRFFCFIEFIFNFKSLGSLKLKSQKLALPSGSTIDSASSSVALGKLYKFIELLLL